MYLTYILECADGSLYTGWTDDIDKRLCAHNAGAGSKYTRARLPVALRYFEEYPTKSAAMRRECAIKKLDRGAKLALIQCGGAQGENAMDGGQKAQTVDAYIAQFSGDIRGRLDAMRQTIKKAAPGAQEKISRAMPSYFLNKNIARFAAFKNHIGLYTSPEAIEAFADELAGYAATKGAIRLPHSKPLPLELVAAITAFRAQHC